MSNKKAFGRIQKHLKNVDEKYEKAYKDEFLKRVVNRTPVDSGTLRNGWKITGSSIENDVPYAGYVEDGTESMAGAHMVKTTMSESAQISKIAMKKAQK